MPPVSASLRALLERSGVQEPVITWLSENSCCEIPTFANWVDDKAHLKTAVLDKIALRNNDAQLAMLKQSWREAEALTARGVKRAAEGLPGE